MTPVAFIGIGAMGEPMATHLLRKGFALAVVRHRSAEPAARLQALGARIAASPAEAVRDCALAVLCLPTSREVEEVVCGPRGLLGAAARGTVIVDCSTSDPSSTRRLEALARERGIGFVAAAMTRGVAGARAAKLAFFVGGEDEALDRAMPVLQAMGDTFVRFASAGAAHAAKLISNVLSYATVALVNEALMLGAGNGVDPRRLFEALMLGAPSKALEAFGPRLLGAEYEPPRVSVEHACADLVLAQELARAARAPLFVLGTAQQLYRLLELRGEGARDISVLAELWHGRSVEA